jgi:hypothetical protein
MTTSSKHRRLFDTYRFTGFRPLEHVKGVFGDRLARVVTLVRRSKKRRAACAVEFIAAGTTVTIDAYATCRAGTRASTWTYKCAALPAGDVGK